MIVTVNNDDNAAGMSLPAGNCAEYVGTLTGQKVSVEGGRINVTVAANSGEIWVPADTMTEDTQIKVENAAEVQATSAETSETKKAEIKEGVTKETAQDLAAQETAAAKEESACANETCAKDADKTDETSDTAAKTVADLSKAPEDMTVAELQLCILAKMATNGPVTDQMKKTVYDNIWHDSLVNWFKSFR